MKHIGEYKGYKVYQTDLQYALTYPKTDTIYSVPSSSGYDAIYLGEKVGHFDHVYCVDWFSQERVDELYKRWEAAEIEAAVRASTPAFVKEEKWSEEEVELPEKSESVDYWNNLTKRVEKVLASVK